MNKLSAVRYFYDKELGENQFPQEHLITLPAESLCAML